MVLLFSRANMICVSFQKRFLDLGGTFMDTTEVQNIKPVNNQLVNVVTNQGIFSASSLVLTCGPWTNKMLRHVNLGLPLEVWPDKLLSLVVKCCSSSQTARIVFIRLQLFYWICFCRQTEYFYCLYVVNIHPHFFFISHSNSL